MSLIYNEAKLKFGTGTDWSSTALDVEVALVSTAYTASPDHDWADITATEHSSTTYSATNMTGRSVSRDDANDRAVFKGGSVSFSALAGSVIGGYVIRVNTGSTYWPVAYNNTAGVFPYTPNGRTLTVSASTSAGYFQHR